jgi:hypothetical protein
VLQTHHSPLAVVARGAWSRGRRRIVERGFWLAIVFARWDDSVVRARAQMAGEFLFDIKAVPPRTRTPVTLPVITLVSGDVPVP